MENPNEFLLSCYEEAKKQAIQELEKELLENKDYPALARLKALQSQSGQSVQISELSERGIPKIPLPAVQLNSGETQ